ncbi:hypothetical protein GGC64_006863 [Mycobacterium sp. OAS707]|nr:hypothetical protein [Mycobacterium sp. OAS707]
MGRTEGLCGVEVGVGETVAVAGVAGPEDSVRACSAGRGVGGVGAADGTAVAASRPTVTGDRLPGSTAACGGCETSERGTGAVVEPSPAVPRCGRRLSPAGGGAGRVRPGNGTPPTSDSTVAATKIRSSAVNALTATRAVLTLRPVASTNTGLAAMPIVDKMFPHISPIYGDPQWWTLNVAGQGLVVLAKFAMDISGEVRFRPPMTDCGKFNDPH